MKRNNFLVLGVLAIILCIGFGALFLFSTQEEVDSTQEACEVTGGVFDRESSGCTCSQVLPIFVTSTQGCVDQFGNTTDSRKAFSILKKRTMFSQICELQDAEPYVVADVSLAFCSPYAWGGAKIVFADTIIQVTFPQLRPSPTVVVTDDITSLFQSIGFSPKKQSLPQRRITAKSVASYFGIDVERVHDISEVNEFNHVFQIEDMGAGTVFLIPYAQGPHHVVMLDVTDQTRTSAELLVSTLWFDINKF